MKLPGGAIRKRDHIPIGGIAGEVNSLRTDNLLAGKLILPFAGGYMPLGCQRRLACGNHSSEAATRFRERCARSVETAADEQRYQ